jgi:2-methylcitrate dehydratase
MAVGGEMGYPSALSAQTWGFYDVLFGGRNFKFQRPFGSYVMENILFKISFPAEFHAQTAVECALKLHPEVHSRLGDISKVVIETQEAGVRIIDKSGPLANYADRDHCLQYMVAVPLIFGTLTAHSYGDIVANDPRVDSLRELMEVRENIKFTEDYFDPMLRGIGNAVQVFYSDGSSSERVEISYPIGHRRRRSQGIPKLVEKYEEAIAAQFDDSQCDAIRAALSDQAVLEAMQVPDFVDTWVAKADPAERV